MRLLFPEEIKTLQQKHEYILERKDTIIRMKRAEKKPSDPFEFGLFGEKTLKSLNTNYKDEPDSGVITRKVIANTYNWMDSHDDVHVGNTFKKSIGEKKAEDIFHLYDHKFGLEGQVGVFQEFKEEEFAWVDLGINKEGTTTSLTGETKIMSRKNQRIFLDYLHGEIKQHSVGMLYYKIFVGLNDPQYKEEYKIFEETIAKLGNPERAEKQGYLFAVKEAGLIETSAVLLGSNELTGTVPNEPSNKDTHTPPSAVKDSHSEDTEQEKKEILKSLLK